MNLKRFYSLWLYAFVFIGNSLWFLTSLGAHLFTKVREQSLKTTIHVFPVVDENCQRERNVFRVIFKFRQMVVVSATEGKGCVCCLRYKGLPTPLGSKTPPAFQIGPPAAVPRTQTRRKK